MGNNCPSTTTATPIATTSGFWPASERHWLHGTIAFSDQAGIMTLLPLNLRFGFEDALQQDGIFRHHTPLLDLQVLDQGALWASLSS